VEYKEAQVDLRSRNTPKSYFSRFITTAHWDFSAIPFSSYSWTILTHGFSTSLS
jgi:hypothetical protein